MSFLHKCSICLCSIVFRRYTGKPRSKHVQRCCTINHQHWTGMNHQQWNCKLFTPWIFTNQRSGQWKLQILNLNVSAISTVGFPNTIPRSKDWDGSQPAGFPGRSKFIHPRSLANSSPLEKWWLIGRWITCPFGGFGFFAGSKSLPSLKLTVRTWKWGPPGSLEIPIGNHHF